MSTTLTETVDKGVKDLLSEYHAIKQRASAATDRLTSTGTLSGLDNVNEIIAEGIKEIEAFTTNMSKPSTLSSVKTKALAVIDPNNKWAGKWLAKAEDSVSTETLKEQTLQQIADRIIASINKQREDVMQYMESVNEVKENLLASAVYYEQLLVQAEALLPKLPENTREQLDAKSLIARLGKSIVQLQSTVSAEIQPLISSAVIAIQEIDAQLPDIEHELKHKGGLKIAQQALSDLIGMANSVKEMTEVAGDAIRKDIRDTTIASIKMVGDVMLDTDRMRKIQQEEHEHMKKVQAVMEETKQKIDRNFEGIQQLHLEHKAARDQTSHVLLENVSVEKE